MKLRNNFLNTRITRGGSRIYFSKISRSNKGYLCGMSSRRVKGPFEHYNKALVSELVGNKKINITTLHCKLGHPNETIVRNTAQNMRL